MYVFLFFYSLLNKINAYTTLRLWHYTLVFLHFVILPCFTNISLDFEINFKIIRSWISFFSIGHAYHYIYLVYIISLLIRKDIRITKSRIYLNTIFFQIETFWKKELCLEFWILLVFTCFQFVLEIGTLKNKISYIQTCKW